jgi:hypothetical protein
MKNKIFVSFAFCLAVLTANAQFRKIPAEVTDAFKTKFVDATNVSWRDNIANFQASFKIGKDNVKASYSAKGEWLKTERSYTLQAIPVEVRDGFKKSKYANWPLKDITYIEARDYQNPLYKLQVRKGDFQKKNLYFLASGQLIDDAITL